MKVVMGCPHPIKEPEHLPLKDGMPYCEDHEEYFEVCICPKPHSTPEEDGWLIGNTPSGKMGYPTEELYRELSLWIQRQGRELVCIICKGDAAFPEGHMVTDTESQDLVEAFFTIHANCWMKGKG